MSKSERRKGQTGELEVARIFQAAGFDCNRTPNSGGLRITGDLYGDVPAHVEVKRQERLQLPAWLRQAAAEAPPDTLPVVAFRQNGGEWYAALPLSGLVDLLAAGRTKDTSADRLDPERAAALREAWGADVWPNPPALVFADKAQDAP